MFHFCRPHGIAIKTLFSIKMYKTLSPSVLPSVRLLFSVRLFAHISAAPTRRISVKYDVEIVNENLSRYFEFG